MRTAFVLSGGGAKGDFEVGALEYLYSINIVPDVVCATSVGSINAIKIAEGPGGFEGLRSIWLDELVTNSDMYVPQPWLTEITNSNVLAFVTQSMRSLLEFLGSRVVLSGPPFGAGSGLFPLVGLYDTITAGVDIYELYQTIQRARSSRSI